MSSKRQYGGFSLIEVLLAVATLAIGMIFVGGTFLVGLHLSGVSAERTTATIVANEAFSKIAIFRVDPGDGTCDARWQARFETLRNWPPGSPVGTGPIDPNELAYPSTLTPGQKQYFWSALCRRDPNDPANTTLQVTVFVSRKIGSGALYASPVGPIDRPVAMRVDVAGASGSNILTIIDNPATPTIDETRWINNGYTIVENTTGDIYRVIDQPANPIQVVLDRPWDPRGIYPAADSVWVVPPAIGHGKGPCIEVYRGKVRF